MLGVYIKECSIKGDGACSTTTVTLPLVVSLQVNLVQT